MGLTHLPPELLETVVKLSIPESFESVAVTCKRIYSICVPFIKHYNTLRSRFHHFTYYDSSPASPTIMSASTLIKRIAVEPVIARYIRHADFRLDSPRRCLLPPNFSADPDCREDVLRLFANSTYLKQAGLDWKEYLDRIEEHFKPRNFYDKVPHYSQHAAVFLLTLLPNVESLVLPWFWMSLDATDKLIDSVIYESKQPHSFHNRPSLAQVIRVDPYCSSVPQEHFDLNLASPFLALPHIQQFCGPSCVAVDYPDYISPKVPGYRFGETLESVSLTSSCVDGASITRFLANAKRLKSFKYEHSTKSVAPQDWDVCRFISAIECQVGNHLTELSIPLRESSECTSLGKISFRGFSCLRQLEFPLQIVIYNLKAIADQGSTNDESQADNDALFLGDLIPASVSILALFSNGADNHDKALDVVFKDFAAKKETTLPNLKEIYLMCPDDGDVAYKDRCTMLLAEIPKTGVMVYLTSTQPSREMTWIGEP